MTGNFTQFNIENRGSESWNEQQAMTTTAVWILLEPNFFFDILSLLFY
jgi:hypothetical protein